MPPRSSFRSSLLLALGLSLAPSAVWAQAFPADGSWKPLLAGGSPIADLAGDAATGRDVVGASPGLPAAYIHSDASYLYFRLRINDSVLQAAPSNFKSFGWTCLVDTDGDLSSYELAAGVNGTADTVELLQNAMPTNAGDPGDVADLLLQSYPTATHAREAPASSLISGNADVFIDWAVARADLAAAGLGPLMPLRLVCGSSSSAQSLTTDLISTTDQTTLSGLATDWIACDDAGCAGTCPELGQPCTVGLGICQTKGLLDCNGFCHAPFGPEPQPVEICDGLDNDCNGQTDEGFAVGIPCTNGVGACAVPGQMVCTTSQMTPTCDAFPNEPAGMETCGNGIDDDCNGTTDEGCDVDGDGILDADELSLGTDPQDADSDDDGVIDGAEPGFDIDIDGDGLIGALDPDSDGDGIQDGTELGADCMGPGTSGASCVPDGDFGATTTDPTKSDTDGGGKPDGAEDADHDGVIDPGETNPNDPADDIPPDCLVDADCGVPTSGEVCDANECKPGCRGQNGNGCPIGKTCTSKDATIGECVDVPIECQADADCGDAESGRVCDIPARVCRDGCRGAGGNVCPAGSTCSSETGAVGECAPISSVSFIGSGATCGVSPGTRSSGGAAFAALCVGLFAAIRRWGYARTSRATPQTPARRRGSKDQLGR